MMNTKKGGQLTAEVAKRLSKYYDEKDFDVLHDHGADPKNRGTIVAYFGELGRETELGQIDIAIFERSSKRVCALIEVEETSVRPKTLLGDAFATLLTEHVSFKGKPLDVCEHVSLLVVGKGDKSDEAMIKHLNSQVEFIRSLMGNARMKVGKVVIDWFDSEEKLEELLKNKVDEALEC